MNLQQYFDKYKDRDLLIDNEKSYSYGECCTFVKKALIFLKNNGLKKNYKILISAKNSILLAKFYLTFLANENEIFIVGENLTPAAKKAIFKKNGVKIFIG